MQTILLGRDHRRRETHMLTDTRGIGGLALLQPCAQPGNTIPGAIPRKECFVVVVGYGGSVHARSVREQEARPFGAGQTESNESHRITE